MELNCKVFIAIIISSHYCIGGASSIVWHQWIVDSSIADGITSTGYITSKTALTSAKCIIECTQMPACKMVGFSKDDGICNLYSVVLTNDLSFSFQPSTTFYRASCKRSDYTYIHSLDVCFKISTSIANFDDARSACKSEGGDLLMMKSEGLKQYLQTNLNESKQYWIGATQEDPEDTSKFIWVDNTEVTQDIWSPGEPNNAHEQCAEIRFFTPGILITNDNPCSIESNYICERV